MRTIALTLEYDGALFHGWQSQNNACAVQDAVACALSKLDARMLSKVVGASRTDAGVHAAGQVASFRTASAIPADKYAFALNTLLPGGITCARSWDAGADFHARFSATGKTYSYRILNRMHPSALERGRAWHVPQPLDVEAMREAAQHFVGERDFRAFMAAGSPVQSTMRVVWSLEVGVEEATGLVEPEAEAEAEAEAATVEPGEEAEAEAEAVEPGEEAEAEAPVAPSPAMLRGRLVTIRISGNGFLYNMVRIIVGTLAYVGMGKIGAGDITAILASGDRKRAGKTAPPQGLCLERVHYG